MNLNTEVKYNSREEEFSFTFRSISSRFRYFICRIQRNSKAKRNWIWKSSRI